MAAECCLQRRKHKLVPGGRGASGDGCFVAEGDRDEAKEQFLHPPPCGSAGLVGSALQMETQPE